MGRRFLSHAATFHSTGRNLGESASCLERLRKVTLVETSCNSHHTLGATDPPGCIQKSRQLSMWISFFLCNCVCVRACMWVCVCVCWESRMHMFTIGDTGLAEKN